MSLQIVECLDGPTFLIVDPSEDPPVIDAYPTRAEAESFLQFIGQVPADVLTIPVPAISHNWVRKLTALDPNHGESCAVCGCPLYTDTPGLCGGCKQFYPQETQPCANQKS